MREFWKTLIHGLEGHQPVCLVSLLSSAGSTPRGAGAMMAVLADGSTAGTIGGGNVEFEAQKLATEVLSSGCDQQQDYRFVQGSDRSLGMVCGGDVSVQFQYISPSDEAALGSSAHWWRPTRRAGTRGLFGGWRAVASPLWGAAARRISAFSRKVC